MGLSLQAGLHPASQNTASSSCMGLGLYQALGYSDKEDPWDLRAEPGVSRKQQPAWDTREGFLEVGPFHLGFGR